MAKIGRLKRTDVVRIGKEKIRTEREWKRHGDGLIGYAKE